MCCVWGLSLAKKKWRMILMVVYFDHTRPYTHMFTQSTLLKESASVVNFLRAHCRNSSNFSSSAAAAAAAAGKKDGEEEVQGGRNPEALRRRELIVKMLIWEKRAVKWYKHDATAYIRALAQRLDAPAVAAILSQSTDAAGAQELLLPLPLLEAEAQALEDAMTKYPEGNVGGVPQVFLQYSATYALNLDEDGLEVVVDDAADAKEGGGGGKGEGAADGKGGGGADRRKSSSGVVAECIELLDDD